MHFFRFGRMIEDKISVYNVFEKTGNCPVFIARFSYLRNNIPPSIFFGSIFEFMRIAKCALRLTDY